jgi:hypothetical protein
MSTKSKNELNINSDTAMRIDEEGNVRILCVG